MRYTFCAIFAVLLMFGQSGAQSPNPPASQSASKKALTPDEIIRQFTQKETQFYEAWIQYTYRQVSNVHVVSVDGRPTDERMRIISEVVFNDDGTREVRTIENTGVLRSVEYSKEDKEIMENINPFALTAKELPLYNLKYEGKQKADELDCYVFSVKPQKIKGGRLYFQGKIWVDDQDLQIVKTVGKAVPQTANNQFPEFETIRQVIDDKYWFPVWTHADSNLYFGEEDPFRGSRQKVVRIEETITYDNYKKFRTEAKIVPNSPTLSDPK